MGSAHGGLCIEDEALLTDLYELAMMQAAQARHMTQSAAFEFSVRRLPDTRNFLLAAGLAPVLDYLSQLHFSEDDLRWLRSTGLFRPQFIDSLAGLRFTGDVYAVPEGTVVFADEPLLRIVAPLREALLVEGRVMNLLHFSTLCASKAARCVLGAGGRPLIDFGMRRSHGAEAALLAARASHVAGFAATATVLAGKRYGIPVAGSMAHSFVQAHEQESDAFMAMLESAPPSGTTLLIDTFDTEAGARKVVKLAAWLGRAGRGHIRAVRLDSGDLAEHARRVRAILDSGGCADIRIMASGNLDEHTLQSLVRSGAPIDEFGVGTRMNTSSDAPYLDCVYKLVEYDGVARRKTSEGKTMWPGCKQIWRRMVDERLQCDVLGTHSESMVGETLMEMVMCRGMPVVPPPSLTLTRSLVHAGLASLPDQLRRLEPAAPYPVLVSEKLRQLAGEVDRQRQQWMSEEENRWRDSATQPAASTGADQRAWSRAQHKQE